MALLTRDMSCSNKGYQLNYVISCILSEKGLAE